MLAKRLRQIFTVLELALIISVRIFAKNFIEPIRLATEERIHDEQWKQKQGCHDCERGYSNRENQNAMTGQERQDFIHVFPDVSHWSPARWVMVST